MRFCGECGTKIENDEQEFCHECGSKLDMIDIVVDSNDDTIDDNAINNEKTSSKRNIIVICLLILVVVAIIIVMLMKGKKDNNVNNEKTTDISTQDVLDETESAVTEDVTTEVTTEITSEENITEITADDTTTEETIAEITTEEVDNNDSEWKEQYLNYINSISDADSFQLIYIDNNDIPELVIYYNTEAGGTEICSYGSTGLFNKIIVSGTSGFEYYEKGGVIINTTTKQGVYRDDVYTVNDGLFASAINGSYFESYSTGEYEDYCINGQSVTPEEYSSKITSFLQNKDAVKILLPGDVEVYDISSIVEKLSN